MKNLLSVILPASSVFTVSVLAASSVSDIRAFRISHEQEILTQYMELLKIPNVASDREDIRRNADAITVSMGTSVGSAVSWCAISAHTAARFGAHRTSS